MPKCIWRGEWYIYNHVLREFVQSMHGPRNGARWTPSIVHARPYKNPSQAQKCASRLNAMLQGDASACYPCQPVSVVTGEAARCLDMINRREAACNSRDIPSTTHGRGAT